MTPTKADFDDPYTSRLTEALKGASISSGPGEHFRQISERYLSQGARHEMFEKFNGIPLYSSSC